MGSIASFHYGNWRAKSMPNLSCNDTIICNETIIMVAEWEVKLMFLLCGVEIWTNAIFQTLDSTIIAAQQ